MKGGRIVLGVLVILCLPCVRTHIHSQKVHYHNQVAVSPRTWCLAVASSCLVGLCGVFPLLLNKWIQLDGAGRVTPAMQIVLSFAVGGLLGDVWLHLLPEAWGPGHSIYELQRSGVWTVIGLFTFMVVEKLATLGNDDVGREESDKVRQHMASPPSPSEKTTPPYKPQVDPNVRGYLNLVANCTDNFTHGLAIAASYLASPSVGMLTTLAVICHEIPHEVGDFAILLRSGFSCRRAAQAQLLTALGGLVGVVTGLLAEELGQCTTWMLPFTGGGFLYIALVSIVPELIADNSAPLKQVVSMFAGIAVMAAVTIVERKSCSVMPDR